MHVIRQYFLDAETPITGGVVPVGYAVDDTDILTLDADGQPLGENGLFRRHRDSQSVPGHRLLAPPGADARRLHPRSRRR